MIRWNPCKLRKARKGGLNDVVVNEFGDLRTVQRGSGSGFKSDIVIAGETPQPSDVEDWEAGDRGFGVNSSLLGGGIWLLYKTAEHFYSVQLLEVVCHLEPEGGGGGEIPL